MHLALLGAARQHPGASGDFRAGTPCRGRSRSADHGLDFGPVAADCTGMLRLDQLEALLEPPTRLVSLIWGQSEVGTVQPLLSVAAACRERGIVLHTDATQLIPQGLVDWSSLPIDLLSCSSHKLQGPRGVGLLLHRPGLIQEPLQGGGGQEGGLRAGTEPVALIGGLAEAMKRLPRFDPFVEASPPGVSPMLSLRGSAAGGLEGHSRGNRFAHPAAPRLPHHPACLVTTPDGSPSPGDAWCGNWRAATWPAAAAAPVALERAGQCSSHSHGG